jgi:hypothetical protein
VVFGAGAQALKCDRGVHDRVETVAQDLVNAGFGPADRQGRAVGQALGDAACGRQELVGRHGLVDQADALGFGSADALAGHQVVLGAVDGQEQRPEDGAAVAGDQADADVRVGDVGFLAHDHDVAGQRQGGAQAHGRAVHGRDDRLVDLEEIDHNPSRLVQGGRGGAAGGGRDLHLLDVAAGAEGAAGAGEEDGADRVILRDQREQVLELLVEPDLAVHRDVDRVQTVGAVEGRGEQLAVALDLDLLELRVVDHWVPPCLWRFTKYWNDRGRALTLTLSQRERGSALQPLRKTLWILVRGDSGWRGAFELGECHVLGDGLEDDLDREVGANLGGGDVDQVADQAHALV